MTLGANILVFRDRGEAEPPSLSKTSVPGLKSGELWTPEASYKVYKKPGELLE